MNSDVNVRIFLRSGDKLIDDGEDFHSSYFNGHIPSIGDSIMYFNKSGMSERYKVVDRAFDINFSPDNSYITLILEREKLGEYAHMSRYTNN
ncbi:hypothetical protein [Aquabacter cavernae]|uniref:hypothetical protein n=1 Tax=Aquabacter cavernae TaxID=2496029 RepID=UPI000F8DFF35|nr:hypothetical protein [Aquabacter cavernae]